MIPCRINNSRESVSLKYNDVLDQGPLCASRCVTLVFCASRCVTLVLRVTCGTWRLRASHRSSYRHSTPCRAHTRDGRRRAIHTGRTGDSHLGPCRYQTLSDTQTRNAADCSTWAVGSWISAHLSAVQHCHQMALCLMLHSPARGLTSRNWETTRCA